MRRHRLVDMTFGRSEETAGSDASRSQAGMSGVSPGFARNRNLLAPKRPADHPLRVVFTREKVCRLIGQLKGTHADGYGAAWS
jgi:hypothetical protein